MLSVRDVSIRHSELFALRHVELEIHEGEIVSIIGPNGSGKSTLLKTMARLLSPLEGAIILEGRLLDLWGQKELAQTLAMLPQTPHHGLDMTVRELVEFGRNPHKRWLQTLDHEDERVIDWALDVTNLKEMENRFLPSLSGGERQRAWIAMAIAQRPKILLLDEPTTHLDIVHQLEVMELVHQLNKEWGVTVVMVLHDVNQAAQYSDRLIAMKQGTIVYDGPPQQVMCRQMFEEVFGVDVRIVYDDNQPFFFPRAKTFAVVRSVQRYTPTTG
ncbi:iron ABC transporter ATP-binding protein [Geobacillus thermocatenulatus]|uniref:Iron ABC transporter ATP-binding protein n=1 Tax=Geobacillus thermocatenulatus TaxID=33938 RepID=A0A226QCM5_9BACL|nr:MULTISPECIES: ABC transporter ATP-binding protein [Geobacillus]ASS98441.1 iron ABC transporter ATP-binding protein [Geobacillus thermocatenulatus]KLR74146.1 iron ABC transporter ATP-binding protein [Geobacillus sp. T6]KPC97668.1 putative siderophore transport system ATP-binding protein YusV [Geobacillus sp. BCO2]OXB89192.1 iron ABC transporter ATP-binding protein [Geobacillus thermocatenulatus]